MTSTSLAIPDSSRQKKQVIGDAIEWCRIFSDRVSDRVSMFGVLRRPIAPTLWATCT